MTKTRQNNNYLYKVSFPNKEGGYPSKSSFFALKIEIIFTIKITP